MAVRRLLLDPLDIGIAALLVLRLMRLDGPLRGWDIPLAGLAVVIGLMLSTSPWAWALAGSIGVLLAGLAQLPWWRLAAVGAVLCVVSGIGFGLSFYQDRAELEQIQTRAGDPMRVQLGTRPARVLPAVLSAVQQDDADPVCRLLTPQAEAQLLGALTQAVARMPSENCTAGVPVRRSSTRRTCLSRRRRRTVGSSTRARQPGRALRDRNSGAS